MPNLQYKWLFWERTERWVRLRVSTNGLKTIEKLGLEEAARRAGLDLWSLNYRDGSQARRDWVEANRDKLNVPKRSTMKPKNQNRQPFIPKWKLHQLARMEQQEGKDKAEEERHRFLLRNSRIYKKQLQASDST